jgi:uncharacterized protein (DUF885 family)
MLADFTRMVRDAERRSERVFDLRPKAPVEVRREPEFTEKNAAAHYTPPAPDGTRPGVFWVPMPGAPYETIGMRTLAYHEAVPGHHFQIALQQEMKELPRFRRYHVFGGISAHAEGWALYAERLAAWWSTPACTRAAGRASRRSTTESPCPRWSATWWSPARQRPTKSAS